MTSAYAPHPRPNGWVRGWRAFRRWSRARPFWGGLLILISAAAFFLSGHLTLHVHISVSPQEFLGWMIPLVLVLCGLLTWLTPAQRVFYGVLASAVSVGGLIGLNLGGFLLGMLLGIVGGALAASWTPVTLPPVAPAPDPTPGVPGPRPEPDAESEPEPIGQGAPDGGGAGAWQRPTGPLADTLPAATVSPLAVPPRTTERTQWPTATRRPDAGTAVPGTAPAGFGEGTADEAGAGHPGRHADAGDGADESGDGAEGSGGAPAGGEPPDGDRRPRPYGGPLHRRGPRGLAAILVVLTVGAVGAATLRSPAPAGATPSCADLFASIAPTSDATAADASTKKPSTKKPSTKKPATGKPGTRPATTAPAAGHPTPTGTTHPTAPATGQPAPGSASPSPSPTADNQVSLGKTVGGLLGDVGKLLGIGNDPDPTTTPTPTATDGGGDPPTGGASPTAGATPTGTKPTGSTPTGGTGTPPGGRPTPGDGAAGTGSGGSTPASDCPTGDPNATVAPLDQTVVAQNPALQITADLTLSLLTYKGVTELPTKGGAKVRVLEFVMDSSTSTPFELRVPKVTAEGHTLSYKSTRLTVSGSVTFYTSRMSGNLLGLVPVTFTPATPPPLPPIPIPIPVTFTNATLDLVLVHADVLTAPALGISYLS